MLRHTRKWLGPLRAETTSGQSLTTPRTIQFPGAESGLRFPHRASSSGG